MSLLIIVLISVGLTIVAIAMGIAVKRITSAWLIFRSQFIVTCPADCLTAGVKVDALHAAATAWRGTPQLRLSGCSRWPERAGCEQPCTAQIRTMPENCLVRTILAKWYEGKYCVRCGDPVGEAYWAPCQPVLLTSDNVMEECGQIPVAELPTSLETARPVCFNCYVRCNVNPHLVGLGSQPSEGPGIPSRVH
jgi:hypothetical protein